MVGARAVGRVVFCILLPVLSLAGGQAFASDPTPQGAPQKGGERPNRVPTPPVVNAKVPMPRAHWPVLRYGDIITLKSPASRKYLGEAIPDPHGTCPSCVEPRILSEASYWQVGPPYQPTQPVQYGDEIWLRAANDNGAHRYLDGQAGLPLVFHGNQFLRLRFESPDGSSGDVFLGAVVRLRERDSHNFVTFEDGDWHGFAEINARVELKSSGNASDASIEWIVENRRRPPSDDLRYGDTVILRSGAQLTEALSSGGPNKLTGSGTIDTEWELVNPSALNSRELIKRGDQVMLYGRSGGHYLCAVSAGDHGAVHGKWGGIDPTSMTWKITDPAGRDGPVKVFDNVRFQSTRFWTYLSVKQDGSAELVAEPAAATQWSIAINGFLRDWMASSISIHAKRLRQITFPASHDAGTWSFLNEIAPEDEKLTFAGDAQKKVDDLVSKFDGITIPVIDYHVSIDADIVKSKAYRLMYVAIQDLSRATDWTIAQQLDYGVRWLDLRVYLRGAPGDGGAYTHHALTGVPMKDVLTQVRDFLAATSGEIVVLEMTHFVGPDQNYEAFAQSVREQLGAYAYNKDLAADGKPQNDPMHKTYDEILAGGSTSKVILIVEGPRKTTSDPMFWTLAQLGIDNTSKYAYANKDTKEAMVPDQVARFTAASNAHDLYTLWYTLTSEQTKAVRTVIGRVIEGLPGALLSDFLDKLPDLVRETLRDTLNSTVQNLIDKAVRRVAGEPSYEYSSLKQLADRINPDLHEVLQRQFQSFLADGNQISVIYGDFVHNSLLVETAIRYSRLPPLSSTR